MNKTQSESPLSSEFVQQTDCAKSTGCGDRSCPASTNIQLQSTLNRKDNEKVTGTKMNGLQSQSSSSGNNESRPERKSFFHFWRCFWLSFLVISLASAWYCYYVPTNGIAWAESYAAAQTKAIQTDKLMILYFTGKWCVPCRIMKRNVWANEQVTASVNARFIPVAIDVDNPDDAPMLARYNIVGSPVTIVTDPDGNALQWRAGGIGKSEFLELLRSSSSSVTGGL